MTLLCGPEFWGIGHDRNFSLFVALSSRVALPLVKGGYGLPGTREPAAAASEATQADVCPREGDPLLKCFSLQSNPFLRL